MLTICSAVEGAVRTRVGYCGGKKVHPSYHDISDHSESVQIEYDPKRVTYEKLVSLFWEFHNPCYRSSRQYRSAIFYHNAEQEQIAKNSRDEKQKQLGTTIRTDIEPATEFTCAEDYHQKYKLQARSNIMKALNVKTYDDLINSPVACKMNGYVNERSSPCSFCEDTATEKSEGISIRFGFTKTTWGSPLIVPSYLGGYGNVASLKEDIKFLKIPDGVAEKDTLRSTPICGREGQISGSGKTTWHIPSTKL